MWLKNLFDRVGGVILFILLFPLLLIIGSLIKIEDGGKIFFLQKRLGKDKKIFKIYKFRTMKENAPDIRLADGSTFNSDDDPRVTKIGKFLRRTSLDELAQIINVIKGDMSFIGPRPDLPDHLKLYEGEEFKKLLVKPGITGYAQVNGRNDLPWKERFKYDIYYAENWSILLDIKIIIKTVSIIFTGKGVNRENV
ncbi:sugar transferase [Cetobacterium sp.]|uniref:sugar transferase n=1 Tax=Cetobacterium sp. TaxID=2071632 RepID=UPI003EE43D60